VQGVQHAQAELVIIMPKIPDGVKVDKEMIGGVNGKRFSDHDIVDVVKFPNLEQENYMECKREGPSGAPLLEPTQWILGL
jgi:hypothetical protein